MDFHFGFSARCYKSIQHSQFLLFSNHESELNAVSIPPYLHPQSDSNQQPLLTLKAIMHQSTLFFSSMILIIAFSAILVALQKVISFMERRHRNLHPQRREHQYEHYSQQLCGCLATAGLVEIILLGISLPIVDHKVLKICSYPGDCDMIAMIWRTITFIYCGVTVLLVCVLFAFLAMIPQSTFDRPRRFFFQPLTLTFGHLLLQFCAVLVLIVSCSDFVFQKVTLASKRDACMVIAASVILVFEVSVAVWLHGMTTLCVETLVLVSRRRRNPQARFQEVAIDLGNDGSASGEDP